MKGINVFIKKGLFLLVVMAAMFSFIGSAVAEAPGSARLIPTFNETYDGYFSGDCWWNINLEQGQNIQIVLDCWTDNGTLGYALYDPNGTLLQEANSMNLASEEQGLLNYTITSDGVYYVKVSGSSGALGAYEITARFLGQAPQLTGLMIEPRIAELAVGDQATLKVTALYANNFSSDVTAEAQLSSSNENSVKTGSGCQITASNEGSARVTASYGGESASMDITVTAEPSLESISLDASDYVLLKDDMQYIVITAHYTGGTSRLVQAGAAYNCGNSDIVEVNQVGCLIAKEIGESGLTVQYGGQSATANVWVLDPAKANAVNYGDIDGNGVADGFDALDILLYEAQLFDQMSDQSTQTIQNTPETADVNGDSSVNGFDSLDILFYEAQLYHQMSANSISNLGVVQ